MGLRCSRPSLPEVCILQHLGETSLPPLLFGLGQPQPPVLSVRCFLLGDAEFWFWHNTATGCGGGKRSRGGCGRERPEGAEPTPGHVCRRGQSPRWHPGSQTPPCPQGHGGLNRCQCQCQGWDPEHEMGWNRGYLRWKRSPGKNCASEDNQPSLLPSLGTPSLGTALWGGTGGPRFGLGKGQAAAPAPTFPVHPHRLHGSYRIPRRGGAAPSSSALPGGLLGG